MNLSDIIKFYLPESQFVIYGNKDLVWCDDTIPQPTQEQIDAWEISYPHDIALVNCKDQAKTLIASSDWSVLSDVQLENKTDFESYRSILRNYILNPVENPIFPVEPQPIWIQN
jgi:hypothetical protein